MPAPILPSSQKTMQVMVVEIVGLSLGTNFTSLLFFRIFFFYISSICATKYSSTKYNTHAGTYVAFFSEENAGDGGADSMAFTV